MLGITPRSFLGITPRSFLGKLEVSFAVSDGSEWKVFNVFCYCIPDAEKSIFTLGGDITFPLHITNSINISKLINLSNIIIAVLLAKNILKFHYKKTRKVFISYFIPVFHSLLICDNS